MVVILREVIEMDFTTLQKAMIDAMKARDKARKDSIAVLVSAAKKLAIDSGCREDIPDEMVDQAILKEIKSIKEQIDTCPADRTELLEEYNARLAVMSEFAPKMLSEDEVRTILNEKFADVIATKNKSCQSLRARLMARLSMRLWLRCASSYILNVNL